MIGLALAAVMALQPAGQRFDLICEVFDEAATGEISEPMTMRLSIDLTARAYCFTATQCPSGDTSELVSVTSDELVLMETDRTYWRIGRRDGLFQMLRERDEVTTYTSGECSPAEFTPPLPQRFKNRAE